MTVGPASVAFGNVVIGVTSATSAAKTVTITNPAKGQPVTGLGLQITGANPGDFTISGNNCASTLAIATSCSAMLTFTPGALGTRTASLVVSDTGNANAGLSALSGTGIAGNLTITPATTSFGNVVVGSSSASKAITVKNPNTATLSIASATASAGFAIASDQCSGGNLAPGATCAIGVVFNPIQTGALSGSVTISDDAAGSPQSVALGGTGILQNPTFSATSLAFGRVQVGSASAAKSLTITNPNIVALNILSISPSAPFGVIANSCGTSIAAGEIARYR